MTDQNALRQEIEETAALIDRHVRTTPVIAVDGSEFGMEAFSLTLKLEFMQHTGSFKARGAFCNLLGREIPPAGVAAASGGNHGAAVAFAAMKLGIPAHIFVPTISSPAKLDRIREYGAELVVGGDRYAEALEACDAYSTESGALSIHAFEQMETLLGQGTTGRELDAQADRLDTLLVGVGGGGFIGGIAAWFQHDARIIGVEPKLAPTLHHALEAGEPVDAPAGGIAADSLAPRRIGSIMFSLCSRYIDEVILVSDEDIRNAQRCLWEKLRVVVEPGGAAAFAALLSGRFRPDPGERVAVPLCGANTLAVDFDR